MVRLCYAEGRRRSVTILIKPPLELIHLFPLDYLRGQYNTSIAAAQCLEQDPQGCGLADYILKPARVHTAPTYHTLINDYTATWFK